MKRSVSFVVATGCVTLLATGLSAKTSYAPIMYRQTSGERPYVAVKLNGKGMLFMVHANTNFNAMTTHANARAVGVTDLVAKGSYGITSVGVKSAQGSATGTVARFAVAGSVIRDMPLKVFEVPQTPPVDGMIGLGWLRQARAMVDYGRNRVAIPATDQDASGERRDLLRAGYTAVPMTWDPKANRFVVEAKVNGRSGIFAVSTVSYVIMDERFARAGNVAVGEKPVDTFGGPTGTTGYERETVGNYTIDVGGKRWTGPKARVFDLYAYDGAVRPADLALQTAGYLGCDFMRANRVVIDFGSGTLFLKTR